MNWRIKDPMKKRRGAVGINVVVSIILVVVGLAIAAYFISALQPTSLGTLANSSTGNAMKNVDATTKSLFNNYPLLIVLVTFTALAALALAVLIKSLGKTD